MQEILSPIFRYLSAVVKFILKNLCIVMSCTVYFLVIEESLCFFNYNLSGLLKLEIYKRKTYKHCLAFLCKYKVDIYCIMKKYSILCYFEYK